MFFPVSERNMRFYITVDSGVQCVSSVFVGECVHVVSSGVISSLNVFVFVVFKF